MTDTAKSYSTILIKGDDGNRSILELPLRTKARTDILFEKHFFIIATPSIEVAPVIDCYGHLQISSNIKLQVYNINPLIHFFEIFCQQSAMALFCCCLTTK